MGKGDGEEGAGGRDNKAVCSHTPIQKVHRPQMLQKVASQDREGR